MPAQIIDGKKISEEIKQEIKLQAEALYNETGVIPGLAYKKNVYFHGVRV